MLKRRHEGYLTNADTAEIKHVQERYLQLYHQQSSDVFNRDIDGRWRVINADWSANTVLLETLRHVQQALDDQ